MAVHRILIVDDESLMAKQLGAQVIRCGFEVAAIASSGREALALAAETQPHLVLMDVVLNGEMGGVEAAEEIRRHSPIPIIFMADDTDDATLRHLREIQPFGHVSKPVSDDELRIHLEAALNDDATRLVSDHEERFFLVSIDMLCCLGFTGYFKRLNPAWERALGFSTQELMARPFIEFVHPDDRERTLKQNRLVRTGGQALAFENRYLCKDGSYRWLLWNAAPDADHHVIYSAARDITESKCAAEERETLVRELQAALAEVQTLRGILPICSYCKKIRDDADYWQTVEGYISQHTGMKFSHGICPECYASEVEPMLYELEERARHAGD
ncbi:MAG: response regulator [Gemmatimonadaceae bacterium]